MADKKKEVQNKASDLRSKSIEELQKLLATDRADLLEAQKSLRANELANPHAVTKMRKEIARILTILAEKNKEILSDSKASNETKEEK